MTTVLARAHPGIAPLIHQQQGVLSSRQAADHGLAHETLRQRVLRGIWQRLLPGVYVLQCGPPTWQQWLIGALVYAGEGSMLTGPAALGEYGLLPARAHPGHLPCIDILVPHRTRRQNLPARQDVPAALPDALGESTSPALRIVRATRLPAPTDSAPLRLAPPVRAVVDTCLAEARSGAGGVVQGTVERALASGRVSLADLEAELAFAPRRHSAPLRAHLARHRDRLRAGAAARLAAAAGTVAGPHDRPMRDVAVYAGRSQVARPTVLWPSRAVAAAVDAPRRELESLERLGFAVLPLTAQNILDDLPGVLRRIEVELRRRPNATLPAGVSLLPDAHRVLTAISPARTGSPSVLPRGGVAQT